MREAVRVFADKMEQVLKENDHKGGWDNETYVYLYRRMQEECEELATLLCQHVSFGMSDEVKAQIQKEAADVANFAMMIHDRISKGALE